MNLHCRIICRLYTAADNTRKFLPMVYCCGLFAAEDNTLVLKIKILIIKHKNVMKLFPVLKNKTTNKTFISSFILIALFFKNK